MWGKLSDADWWNHLHMKKSDGIKESRHKAHAAFLQGGFWAVSNVNNCKVGRECGNQESRPNVCQVVHCSFSLFALVAVVWLQLQLPHFGTVQGSQCLSWLYSAAATLALSHLNKKNNNKIKKRPHSRYTASITTIQNLRKTVFVIYCIKNKCKSLS